MEIIAFILVLAIVFAAKAVSILRWQDDEIANSTSFAWTKPGVQLEAAAPAIQTEAARSTSWAPSTAVAHLRSNRWVAAR